MTLCTSNVKHNTLGTALFLTLLFTLGLSGNALASGGGSSYGHSNSSDSQLDTERYTLGKSVYKNHVNCSNCLVNQAKLSKQEALALYKRVKQDKALNQSLSKKERRALKYYMRERFKL